MGYQGGFENYGSNFFWPSQLKLCCSLWPHEHGCAIAHNIIDGTHTGEVWVVPEQKFSLWWDLLNATSFISWLRLKDDDGPVLVDRFGNAVNTMYNLFALYIKTNTMTEVEEQDDGCLDTGTHNAKIHQ